MRQRTKGHNNMETQSNEYTWEDKINELKTQLQKENNNMELSNLESKHKQLLQITIKIADQNIWMLIDSGAIKNFISESFVKQQQMETKPMGTLSVQLPDGRDKGVNKAVIIKQLKFPQHNFKNVVAYVMPLQQYDLILGKS